MNTVTVIKRHKNSLMENRKIESKILGYNQLIDTLEVEKDKIKSKIQNIENDSKNKKEKINENT